MKNLNLSKIKLIALASTLLVILGCGSSPTVKYADTKAVETVNTDFGATDLQTIAEKMTGSLLESPIVLDSREPPIVTLYPVKNKTSDYIDTNAISTRIRGRLVRSGRVQFAASTSEMQNQVEELKRQNQNGLYSSQSQVSMGQMTGAQFRLEGFITSIVKQNKDVKDVFYTFHLTLINNKTGLIVWEDEQDIRKTASR